MVYKNQPKSLTGTCHTGDSSNNYYFYNKILTDSYQLAIIRLNIRSLTLSFLIFEFAQKSH